MATPKITIEQKTITPTLAKKFLEKNHPKNRPIQWGRVDAFVADIRRDAWVLTHQGICFDENDQLIDGQHRLHAIVRANIAVEMVVAHNTVGVFEAPIDRGQPRSLSLISGKTRREIAVIGMLRYFEAGFAGNTPITLEDLEEFRGHHSKAIERFQLVKGHTRLLGGAAAACVWAMPVSESMVTSWMEAALTGEMLSKGNPALAFRRWNERQERLRPTPWALAMATFNCLRHAITGAKLGSVYTGESGFRAITSQRRKLKVSHTPSVDLVPSLALNVSREEIEGE